MSSPYAGRTLGFYQHNLRILNDMYGGIVNNAPTQSRDMYSYSKGYMDNLSRYTSLGSKLTTNYSNLQAGNIVPQENEIISNINKASKATTQLRIKSYKDAKTSYENIRDSYGDMSNVLSERASLRNQWGYDSGIDLESGFKKDILIDYSNYYNTKANNMSIKARNEYLKGKEETKHEGEDKSIGVTSKKAKTFRPSKSNSFVNAESATGLGIRV